ncbi:MAG: hypothetical protein JXD21_07680 [Candidatus Omnitrophica bacterium]|nr:hypothetical protein [Candidatus Omnitrophota bacterium]
MTIMIQLLAISLVIEGSLFLVKPQLIRSILEFWKQGTKFYFGALGALLFGIIFILNIQNAALPIVMVIFGIISLLKGTAIIFARKPILSFSERIIPNKPFSSRMLALGMIAIGILLFYSV